MPGMDGFAVAAELKRQSPGLCGVVLMLTADDLNAQLARMRELGLERYAVKPLRRAELMGAIARALVLRQRTTSLTTPSSTTASALSASPAAASATTASAPAASKPAAGTAEAAPSASPRDEPPLRMLLTDDSPDNRMLIKAYCKRLPWHIDEAENGDDALRRFGVGGYDIVLMDLQMPVMDGVAAIRAIRSHEASHHLPRTPIIALTASVLDEDVHKSLDAGADAHVSKPVTKATLLAAVRKAAATKVIHDSASAHAA